MHAPGAVIALSPVVFDSLACVLGTQQAPTRFLNSYYTAQLPRQLVYGTLIPQNERLSDIGRISKHSYALMCGAKLFQADQKPYQQ